MKKETQALFRDLAFVSSLGFSIPLSTVIGLFFGWWLDNRVFGTSPWLTVIFILLGIVAGFRNIGLVLRRAKKMQDD